MRAVAIAAFLGGLVLWIRVMFFGVRRVDEERLVHTRWPLALSAFFTVGGAMLYARARTGLVTAEWFAAVGVAAALAAAAAWWVVQRSAAIPSTDPEDDPRYQFQGHVARITQAIGEGDSPGRIAFDFDGKRVEFLARWSPAAALPADSAALGQVGAEVVIEVVEGEVAFVEPWSLVEERL